MIFFVLLLVAFERHCFLGQTMKSCGVGGVDLLRLLFQQEWYVCVAGDVTLLASSWDCWKMKTFFILNTIYTWVEKFEG